MNSIQFQDAIRAWREKTTAKRAIKSERAFICLWYVMLAASAANVLQWVHHRSVVNTLEQEVARWQLKHNAAVVQIGASPWHTNSIK